MYRLDSMIFILIALMALCSAMAAAQPPRRETIYDESKVPPYTLPGPIGVHRWNGSANGKNVATKTPAGNSAEMRGGVVR